MSTTYAVRCLREHNPKPHLQHLRTDSRDDVLQEYRLKREKIGELGRCEITAFPDLHPNLPKHLPALLRVDYKKASKYFRGG